MIPDFQSIMLPLMQLLQDGHPCPLNAVMQSMANHFGLSEEDLQAKVPSGQQPLFKNRVTWAISYLKNAGLVYYPQRGVYQITEPGRAILKEKIDKISISYLKKFDAFKKWQSSFSEASESPINTGTTTEGKTPEEIIGDTVAILNGKLVFELLETLKTRTPREFETFVLKLLNGMGYGGTEEKSFEVVGQSGDNGIDGIIYLDQFGIDRVYVQAKKWADTKVNSKEIRDFIGALSIKGTNKGIFITTSEFTDDAYKIIQMNPHNRIILINGQQLAQHAIKHNIGVQLKTEYQVKTLDNDFFEEL